MPTLLVTTAAGLDLMVRFVLAGARYGRDDALTADRPLIEFYDAAGPGPFGQFIARYSVATFGDNGGITLDMGNPRYYVDQDTADEVREWVALQLPTSVVDRSAEKTRLLARYRDPSRPPFAGAVAISCEVCGTHILWVNPPLPPVPTRCKACNR